MHATRRKAALGYLENAFGIDFSGCTHPDNPVVAGHFPLEAQLSAGVTHWRMEEEDNLQQGLNQFGVATLDVCKLVFDHCTAFGGRRPIDDVGRKQNCRANDAVKNQRMDFGRGP